MTAELVEYERSPMGSGALAGRNFRARRDFRRRCALAAATEVFVARGYHSATMSEIAERAGFSKPVLYKQFSSKLELYLAVLQEHIDALTENVRHAVRSAAPSRDRVHTAVRAYFDFFDSETQGFRLVFDSDALAEPSVQWRLGRAADACVDAITLAIAQDAAMTTHQARLLAAGLVGASQFAARYWLDTGRTNSKDDAIDAVVTLCWGGLSRVPLSRTEATKVLSERD
ncbi:TetR/AcrR family transcriptional regulator [Nocardia sp. NPDC059240]|uniref:TetR/AcrR family transcriptional regulator n=1 Tax=Nocardia sp. NPDC059240 TaxID=3346786 RepID=UPI0036AEA256